MVEQPGAGGRRLVSVDTKKKELIGKYKNNGREWRPAGEPEKVETYDFIDKDKGKAIPYGIYDVKANSGFVSVGTDADTAAFAVASRRSWWAMEGAKAYPAARRLLICADAGGSNGYRVRQWKVELAALVVDAEPAGELEQRQAFELVEPGQLLRRWRSELTAPARLGPGP